MRNLLLLTSVLLLCLVVPAFADQEYSDDSFSIYLPDGAAALPDSEGWAEAENVAFRWDDEEAALGIYSITGAVDTFDAPMDEELFREFLSGMDGAYAEDGEMEVIHAEDHDDLEGRSWASRLVTAEGGEGVHVETFSTWAGPNIYTFTFGYTAQPDEDVYTAVYTILGSFITPYDTAAETEAE
jgi:hypothetical protein